MLASIAGPLRFWATDFAHTWEIYTMWTTAGVLIMIVLEAMRRYYALRTDDWLSRSLRQWAASFKEVMTVTSINAAPNSYRNRPIGWMPSPVRPRGSSARCLIDGNHLPALKHLARIAEDAVRHRDGAPRSRRASS